MVEYPPVLTKKDFVRRYANNEFGNHSPTWHYLGEYLESGYKGYVHFRNRVAGGPTYYNIPSDKVVSDWVKLGYGVRDLYISGMAPHHKNLIQGELLVDVGWHLTYSDEPDLPMRDALAKCTKTATGVLAYNLVKSVMCPNSWEWLQVLLVRYEGHVVEFSSFSVPWGTLPHHNTCFWEVRGGY